MLTVWCQHHAPGMISIQHDHISKSFIIHFISSFVSRRTFRAAHEIKNKNLRRPHKRSSARSLRRERVLIYCPSNKVCKMCERGPLLALINHDTAAYVY